MRNGGENEDNDENSAVNGQPMEEVNLLINFFGLQGALKMYNETPNMQEQIY